MRLRHVKNAEERLQIDDNKYYISNPKEMKGKWREKFNNSNPIHLEIGCGKGQFIVGKALANPDINFIAVEKFNSVLLRALEKILALEKEINNLYIMVIDAEYLNEYFIDGEIDKIYLNFSDPWPKARHAKRRLTSEVFLDHYKHVLAKDGEIEFKTDNRGLFEYSLESLNRNGFLMYNISLDLHKDLEKYPDNITTEFEDKWSKLGPIYHLEAKLK